MNQGRILIVSYWAPPYVGIGSLRIGKLSKFLTEQGWDARVLMARSDVAASLPVEIPLEKSVATPWFEVDHAFNWLIPKWYRRMGESSARNNPASTGLVTRKSSSVRDALRRAYCQLVRWPDSRIGWLPYATRAGRHMLESWRPDIIYASSPPATSLIVADRLARTYNVPWVAEFRDLWVDNSYYEESRLRRTIEERWEARVLGRAKAVVTVSPPWRELLSRKLAKPVALVMNGHVIEDFPEAPPAIPSRSGPLQITYTGHIYKGYRDPSPVFRAVSLLGAERKSVCLEFVGTNNDELMSLARLYGVEDQIVVKPPVPYRDALGMQMRSDILLLLHWDDPRENGMISAKLFEYLAARRPILAVCHPASCVAEILGQRNAGPICRSPEEVTDQLRKWIAEKRAGGIPPLSEDAAAGLSRNEQFCGLEQFLQDIRRAHRPSEDRIPYRPSRDPIGITHTFRYQPIEIDRLPRPHLVTLVDAEEEFNWDKPFSRSEHSTAALADLPRIQEVFRRWNVIPTYLADYPVIRSPLGRELLTEWSRRGECVIGAQLHPWVNPPHIENVDRHNSYGGNLPEQLEREKLRILTEEIELNCGVRPVVYRAGRYGLGPNTASILEELGYLVDTSILPFTDMSALGGCDYGKFTNRPFWFGQRRRMLELPVTRAFDGFLRDFGPLTFPKLDRWAATRTGVLGPLARLRAIERITLTPEGITFDELRRLTETLLRRGHRVFTFSFHSPSISPGNTPYVKSTEDSMRFVETIERYFAYFMETLGGNAVTPLAVRSHLEGSGESWFERVDAPVKISHASKSAM